MTLIESVVLGIVQGLTEFLPVSSSAHLVLVPAILKWENPSVLFIVALHVGTLLACLIYFRQDVKDLAVSFFTSLGKLKQHAAFSPGEKLVWLIIASTFPTAFFGFLFKDFFESLFKGERSTALCLLGTAVMLSAAERLKREKKPLDSMSFRDAVFVGLGQTASIAPGISRSGACLSSAVVLGFSKTDAARYAFLLSLPAVLGAVVLEGLGALKDPGQLGSMPVVAAGVAASFISAVIAIDFFLKTIKRFSLSYFSAYCMVFSLSSLAILR